MLLTLLLLLAQDADPAITARFACEPKEVEVGEPFHLVLELSHPTGASVFDLAGDELALDDTWVVLGEEREPPVPDPADDGRRITRRTWTLASLEPGTRRLAEGLSALVLDERVGRVDARETTLTVRGVLAAGEDAPRPLRGLSADFGRRAPLVRSPWRWAALGLALLFWGLLGVILWRRRRRRLRAEAPGPTLLERFEALAGEAATAPDALRSRHFALTEILRATADERLGRERRGLTDFEWLADVRASHPLGAELENELTAVFERAREVKYAGSIPTEWALEETIGKARRALVLVMEEDGQR